MTKNQSTWFDVDRAGLEKILRRKGVEFAVFELIQNAWDEAGVSDVEITLEPAKKYGCAMLRVQDNSANGFSNLRHAYTLFAESEKKANAQQRGRFNLGEKLVLSLCEWATITTTKGTVVFDGYGRSESKKSREFGTIFEALIHMSKAEIEQTEQAVQRLIVPDGIVTRFNGVALEPREPAHKLEALLRTEVADAEGFLRTSTRKATVNCYALRDGEQAFIYEMGIPIVEHDCAFHCDVMQKVPLTIDRENVAVKFLNQLRTAVFNATHESLDVEQCNHEWTQTAIESGDAKPEAIEDYMEKRFGEKRVSFDMHDREANNKAVANGYTLIHGGTLSAAAWQNVKAVEAIMPAGRVFPTHSDNFIMGEPAEETDGMKAVRVYAQQLAQLLLGCDITVAFCKQPTREAASWGSKVLSFNVRNLGKSWFSLHNNREAILDLIVHEFGHHFEANHLSEKYNDALSKLAAKGILLAQKGLMP
jgi:hypothetical protein